MKISYHVLWFDDQLDKITGLKMTLRRILSGLGFQLKVDEKDTISPDEIRDLRDKLSVYNPYDLIIFDHDMGQNQKGANIAAELRSSIFTDMVYYSSSVSTDLRKELFEKKIDGVFIAQRDQFESDMVGIVTDHTKRICDLNNMRGLVLDFMSEIDLQLRKVLEKTIEKSSIKEQILQEFQKKHTDRSEQLAKKSKKLQADDLNAHIYDFHYVDFNLIRCRLADIYPDYHFLQSDNILEEMQDLRNALAHQPYSVNNDNNKVAIIWKKQKKDFDFKEFMDIRTKLLTILKELEKMNNDLGFC